MQLRDALTPLEIEHFWTEGYVIRKDVFFGAELADMRAAFERLAFKSQSMSDTQLHNGSQFVVEHGRLKRVVWCGACEPHLLQVGADPRLVVPAGQLLGSDRTLFA